ncbi:MAG: hypothetical protein ACRD3W_12375 [Terriglobales bacterium]
MVVLTLREMDVKRSAADFVFDVLGTAPNELAEAGVISDGQSEDLSALQEMLFDKDDQGYFIRDSVLIAANGGQFDPDAAMTDGFVKAERDGAPYMRCDLVISIDGGTIGSADGRATHGVAPAPCGAKPGTASGAEEMQQKLDAFSRMMFIHQIAIGFVIDVTKEYPELAESIAEAERHEWIEIDTQKVAYKLTAEGQKMHQSYIAEAQDLIKRYDIYGDVDIDMSGNIRFDTKLGKDYRVSVFEIDGVDPFRARFLIGLSDAEWDQLSDWPNLYKNPEWYEYALDDIAQAPTVEEIGRDTLRRILDAGKSQLRMDSRFR